MATISVGAAVAAGFRLIFRKPLTVLTWGFVLALGFGAFFATYFGFLFGVIASVPERAGAVSDTQAAGFIGRMLMFEGGFFLAVLLFGVLRLIVSNAIWRSILHPERGAWSYLRLGSAELWMGLFGVALMFAGNVIIVPAIPFMLFAGALVAMHQYIAAIAVGVVGLIAIMSAMIYLQLRFALLGPMVVDDSRFHFADAWRLTRGNVGSLFYVGLSLVGITLAIEVVLYLIVAAVVVTVLSLSGWSVQAATALPAGPGHLGPWAMFLNASPRLVWALGIGAVIAIPILGALHAVLVAPWARAYRDLAPRLASAARPVTD